MEKFALLNLLKAINGLSGAQQEQNPPPSTPVPPPPAPSAEQQESNLPNFMYEALMRHETVSNRLRNRK